MGPGDGPSTAFTWSAESGYQDLGLVNGFATTGRDLNEGGTVGGWRGFSASSSSREIIWSRRGVLELPTTPGGTSSRCMAINNLNQACGSGLFPVPNGTASRAFFWNGEMNEIGALPAFLASFALDMNDRSEVIGFCRTLNGFDVFHGFVWSGGILRDLNDLVPPDSGVVIDIAWSIRSGRLVGECVQNQRVLGFVLDPVSGPVGDVNLDCRTNVSDLLIVINEWWKTNSPADLNGDGIVNVLDLYIVIQNWSA